MTTSTPKNRQILAQIVNGFVGMRRRRERVVSPHRQGDRQERPGVFDEEPDSGQKLPVEVLALRDAVRTDIAARGC